MLENTYMQSKQEAMLPKVAIIILNWNGWRDTIECLESILKEENYPNYEILVVDNGSQDNSVSQIEQWARDKGLPICIQQQQQLSEAKNCKLLILPLPENIGYPSGNNIGLKLALYRGAQFMIILNNDTVIEPNFLKSLVEAALIEKDVALVGAVICNYPDRRVYFAGGYTRLLRNYYDTELNGKPKWWSSKLVGGSAMLISRQFLEKEEKWLDERLFAYGEEVEICTRALKKGYKVLVARDAKVLHKVGTSLGPGLTPSRAYYIYRNKLILMKDLLSVPERVLFVLLFHVKVCLRLLQALVQRNWALAQAILEALKDGWRAKGGKWRFHGK